MNPEPAANRTVLVVDDDHDVAMVCSLHLQAAGFEVRWAGTGQEAVDLVGSALPDVIVLDYSLPDVDGIEVLRRLRAHEPTSRIPVVMLTARTLERDQLAAWEAGVNDYLVKPFEGSRLVASVTSLAQDGRPGVPRERRVERRSTWGGDRRSTGRQGDPSWGRDRSWAAAIVESASDAVVLLTPEGLIHSWNEGAVDLYGWQGVEVLGSPVSVLTVSDDLPMVTARRAAAARSEPGRAFETAALHRDGRRLRVSWSLSPVRDASGSVWAVSAVVRDVTERARAAERLSGLVETAPDAMVVVDDQGRIELVNARAEALFGHHRDALMGQDVEVLVPEPLRARHRAHRQVYGVHPTERGFGARRAELTALRADGSTVPVEIRLTPLPGSHGPAYAATVRELPDRSQGYDAIRNLIEAAPDAVVCVDTAGLVRLVNGRAERMFGHARDELVGRPVERLVPERFHATHLGLRTSYVAQRHPRATAVGRDLLGLRRDGTEFPVQVALSTLEHDDAQLTLAWIRDVTERRRAEEAQALAYERERQASSRLLEVDRLRTDFLSTVSHELRTPLTAIRGFSEWLVGAWDQTPDERRRDMVVRMLHAGSRLDFLIQDLLDFSRQERGQLKVELAPHPVAPLVEQTLEHVADALEDRRLDVRVEPGTVVLADRSALMRVLENLLTNAAKFSSPGSTISVTARGVPGGVALVVADSGIGIDPGEHEKVFDRFYRVPGEAAERPGTGIGLAIVKQFAEAQGATVSVSSVPGEGTMFTVTLRTPAQHPPSDASGPSTEAPPAEREQPGERWRRSATATSGEEYAQAYAERFDALAAAGAHVHGEVDFVAARVPTPARLLDAGCGTGRIAQRLAEVGFSVVGVDVDVAMVEVARQRAPELDWYVQDLAELEVPGLFDAVVLAGNVVPFLSVEDLPRVLGSLAGVLAPGGLLVTGFGTHRDHLPAAAVVVAWEEYDAVCRAAGLELVERCGGWAGEPPSGSYAVGVHRRPA